MKKKYLIYALVPAFAVALLAAGVTYASTGDNGRPNPFGKIAEAIANKFNLNTSDVQAVIDENMAAQRAEMEKNRPEKTDFLAKAVTDGKLTQAQADLITAKREEMKTAMENCKDMTQAERQAAMKTQMESLKQWATDNNIPEQYMMGMGGFRNGMGGRNFDKNKQGAVKTQTTSK